MTVEQRENYRDYILRNIFRKFDGRPHSELVEFLDYAKEISSRLSFVSSQGREIENVEHLIK